MLIESAQTSLEELRRHASAGRLYAVVDACDTPSVPARADELGEGRAVSLYSGTAQEEYWSIAPYLFRVDGGVLDWITRDLWTEPWGIFAIADADFEAVRRHFKKFLVVRAPSGEQWYFRYYDPRVLTVFLPTCDPSQLGEIFGPIGGFVAGDGNGGLSLLRRREQMPRAPASPPAPGSVPPAPAPPEIHKPSPPRRQIRISV